MRSHLFPLLMAVLVCTGSEAAIPLNSLETFQAPPKVGDWGWLEVFAGAATVLSPEDLDRLIQTNDVSIITRAVDTLHIRVRWNSNGYIQSRANDVAYQVLLATIQNTSGSNLSSVAISYDFGNPFEGGESPGLNGLRAYYSLTGQPGTWWILPEFSTGETGTVSTVIPLGHWSVNSLLYLLWADDNGPGTDGTFSIDNFGVISTVTGPTITGQPAGTNIFIGQPIQLSVAASGFGLSYQWYKDSVPIDVGVNPTANRATLIVTNAQLADSGQYHVVVSNAVSVATSTVVVVNVTPDTTPPRMVHFSQVFGITGSFGTNVFRLAVTEPLIEGPPVGPSPLGDALAVFNWELAEVGTSSFIIPWSIAPENETNYIFTLPDGSVDLTKRYYLRPVADAVTDRFTNALSGSITSSPVRIFNTDIADAEIHSQAGADTALGTATAVSVDNDDAGIAQGLLRFNDLFGPGDNQIPPGSIIINATLVMNQTDPGSPVNFHRMLVNWDQNWVT